MFWNVKKKTPLGAEHTESRRRQGRGSRGNGSFKRGVCEQELLPGAVLVAFVVFLSSFAGAKKFAMKARVDVKQLYTACHTRNDANEQVSLAILRMAIR